LRLFCLPILPGWLGNALSRLICFDACIVFGVLANLVNL